MGTSATWRRPGLCVTRQAQSKIDKSTLEQLQSNGRYIKAILKITGKKKTKKTNKINKQKKTVADRLVLLPQPEQNPVKGKQSKQQPIETIFYYFFS